MMPVNSKGEFGLIFIFDNIYAHRPWKKGVAITECPQLEVSDNFPVHEDIKWCVVMTLRDS
jgi:hypothetical protein